MNKILTITNERVDDIPILLAQMEKMGLQNLLDTHFPQHGNWAGLSLGWVVVIWLAHILSMGDHRLNHVQAWAQNRLHTLWQSTGQLVKALDFSDDRLAGTLYAFSDDNQWGVFESDFSGHLIRVYDLSTRRVRSDSTTASGYWTVTENGLFQFGHSKKKRPDLPQVKVMLSSLDPLGMPLAVDVLSGQRADDPLYIPSITRVRSGLDRKGLLYVGDCKMASLKTRAFIHAGGDFYLCPLPEKQLSSDEMESYVQPVLKGDKPLTSVYRNQQGGKPKLIAKGYETNKTLSAEVNGELVTWQERRLVVRSMQQAKASEARLRVRVAKAKTEVDALNNQGQGKRRFDSIQSLKEAAEAIMKRYDVQGCLQLSFEEIVINRRKVRRYKDRPERICEKRKFTVKPAVDEKALGLAIEKLGWRVYATNQPSQQLSLEQAVLAYRDEYIVERGFGRLKGRPLSLSPLYLQRDDHVTGLIRLLSIGLRVLTLIEFVVRRHLNEQHSTLQGLYAGNPKRATARPTSELLLESFEDITLTFIHTLNQTQGHLTPLLELQKRILYLLDFSVSIYTRLCTNFEKPP